MKKRYYYICMLSVLLLMLVLPTKAASEAEFDKLVKSYTLRTDGSQEMRVQKELTLFTHAAMNGLYGESFIIYNPAYQELKIHESYTRQKDGSIVKTPDNAFVEVLPSAAADAPAYNGLKEMVVVHTGLELGATIYLDYSVITRPGYLPELDICESVEELSPIKEYVLSLSVPDNKPLHYELLNGKMTPVVKTVAGMKTVTWTLKNVQPRPRMLEVSVPAGNMQAVVASTYGSKANALKVLKKQFPVADDKVVAELAQKLTADAKTTDEKVHRLETYIRSLGTCRLSLLQTGYRLRRAAEVSRSAYGAIEEKSVLQAALQQAAGIPTEVKAAFLKATDEDAVGLSALNGLFVENQAIADLRDFYAIVNMDAHPVQPAVKPHAISRTDTLKITPEGGKVLAGGYRMYTLPQASEGWAAYEGRMTTLNSQRPVNLLLSYLPDETYTCIVETTGGMVPVALPVVKKIDNNIGTVEVAVKKTGDKIEIFRSLKLKKQLITPTEYPIYYRLMTEWMDTAATTLLF